MLLLTIDLSIRIIWMSLFLVLRVSGECFTFTEFYVEISVCMRFNPDQTPLFLASDQGLQYLHIAPKWASDLKQSVRTQS